MYIYIYVLPIGYSLFPSRGGVVVSGSKRLGHIETYTSGTETLIHTYKVCMV